MSVGLWPRACVRCSSVRAIFVLSCNGYAYQSPCAGQTDISVLRKSSLAPSFALDSRTASSLKPSSSLVCARVLFPERDKRGKKDEEMSASSIAYKYRDNNRVQKFGIPYAWINQLALSLMDEVSNSLYMLKRISWVLFAASAKVKGDG